MPLTAEKVSARLRELTEELKLGGLRTPPSPDSLAAAHFIHVTAATPTRIECDEETGDVVFYRAFNRHAFEIRIRSSGEITFEEVPLRPLRPWIF